MSPSDTSAALLDGLPQQVWQADSQGHLLWMNARLAEVLGRPALPTLMAHWMHAEDRIGFMAAWAEAQQGDAFEREYRFHDRWVLAQARRLPGTQLWVGTHTDIAHRRAAEDVWKLALECAGDGVWDWHVAERAEYFSAGFMRLYGFEPGDVDANPRVFDGRTHPDDTAQMARDREDHFAGRTPLYRNEHRVRTKDGTWKWVLSRGLVISRDATGQPLRMVGTHTDITEQKAAQARAWQQARLDSLTGLPNRRALRERMARLLAQRVADEQLAVLFVDLDHFKEVNDSLGHDAGDELLVQAAQRLQDCLPPSGVVARMGGDEFTVLLPAADAHAAADDAGRCILDAMADAFEVSGRRVYVSASVGVSVAPRDGSEIEALFKHADQALYEAKGAGRNRMSEFTPVLQEAADRRVQLAGELREALGRGQLSLVYQPILSLRDPAAPPRKAEALLRWTHPQLGAVSPAQFIPVAEASGLIVEIGDWVFHEAVSQACAWRQAGHAGFQVSINKSPVQFRSERTPGLRPDWIAHLQTLGLNGDALVIEITEGLLLDRDDAVAARLRGLREAGVSISLDDFGTGFSALSYLQHHPIDIIKIDRSFVAGIETSAKSLALCRAIVTMAHELGMEVVAEGVETEAQRVALREMGCDWGQGWWFGKGVSASEFEERWFGASSASSGSATTR